VGRINLRDIESKVEQLLDRLLEASGASVITAYERRVRELQSQKAVISDRIAACGKPQASFEETYRTALRFLRNPWKLWHSERIEDRRALLRLVFAERLVYARGEGYRTAKISMPFRLLDEHYLGKTGLVDLSGEKSNHILDELANWEAVLKGSSLANPTPPAP
jgi:site-specific DNA recombinase